MLAEYSPETQARFDSTVRKAVGPTILMGSGVYFDFEAPDSTPMSAQDVAYALAFECRFAGQCVSRRNRKRVFYCVAEHCVRMSRLVPAGHEYDALMHEAGEAPCGDMTGPLKRLCPDYKAIEKRCESSQHRRFKVPMRDKELIKEYDIVMLAWERRDLTPWTGETWSFEPKFPVPAAVIRPWGPYRAAREFMRRFREVAPDDVLREAGLRRPLLPRLPSLGEFLLAA